MNMDAFSGSAVHTIDPKGRVFVPTNYREALGENFTISLNNDLRTLALYPQATWKAMCETLARIPSVDRFAKNYVRYVLGNTYTDCNLDGQGRILVPQTMRAMFDLKESKDVRFIGVGECLEIWNVEKYHGLEMVPDEQADRVLDYIYERYFRNTIVSDQ